MTKICCFKGGKAVFTFPMGAIKCPGAPQKIVYMAEESWRQKGIKADIEFRSSLGVLFGVKKYADALWEVVKGRGINVHLKQNLVEVKPETKEAVFENLDSGQSDTDILTHVLLQLLILITLLLPPLKTHIKIHILYM